MTESTVKKSGLSLSNINQKSKKEEAESAQLKDATNNKLNSSQPIAENKELSTQKSGGFKFWKRNKPETSPAKNKDITVEMKSEIGYSTKKRDKPTNSKFINRRNITGGRVTLSNKLVKTDEVPESFDIPIKENIYELLDQAPTRVSSHLENRKTGKFSWISKRAIKNLMETKAQGQKPIRGDHMEDDLINLINEMTEFYHKLFFFFQGLLSGLCLMHLLLIYIASNDNLSNYSTLALRLNQVFHIVSLLAVFGSIYRSMHAKNLYNHSLKNQSETLGKDRKSYLKNLTAFFCFVIVYALVIYTNEFASSISKVSQTISTKFDQYSSNYNIWRVLNVIESIFAFLGWIMIVSNSEIERPSKSYEELEEEEEEEDNEKEDL